MTTMEGLQKAINERAIEKLENDLFFLTQLHNLDGGKYLKLLEGVFINVGTAEQPIDIQVVHIFNHKGTIYQKAFNKNIGRYIKEETALFLKEIEDLKIKAEKLKK